MKIYVSAAEISSDIHAEKILRSILDQVKAENPQSEIQIAGIGGPKLRSLPGFHSLENAENLRAMGFSEVLGKLKFIRSVLDRAEKFLTHFDPDLILTFDYPDFHMRLLSRLKKKGIANRALKVCGIPPKVWVWRAKRVEKIRAVYDLVWAIFPFEKTFYEKHGIPVIYEGNPLIADLLDRAAHESKLVGDVVARSGSFQSIVVMPGSREAELKYHLPLIPPTLKRLSEKLGKKIHALVPVPEGLSIDAFSEALTRDEDENVVYTFHPGQNAACLKAAPVGLIKSGTSTLEAVCLGCVPVIFYKPSTVTQWIFRLVVRYLGPVGLPNILLGIKHRSENVFPEVLGPYATPENLSSELYRLLSFPALLAEKHRLAEKLRTELTVQEGVTSGDTRYAEVVSTRIAAAILGWQKAVRSVEPLRRHSPITALLSLTWSSVNWIRRRLHHWRFLPSKRVPGNSVLVGNLQAGGAGKTPLVIEIAREAVQRGMKVAVLSRGYGRKTRETVIVDSTSPADPARVGDEPAEIKRAVPGVILGVDPNRWTALKRLPPVDLVIFDDGFQNLKFIPKVTVLATTSLGPSQVVYRDFESEKRFADVEVSRKGLRWNVIKVPEKLVHLITGVGDPEAVKAFYLSHGLKIRKFIPLPDHADFTSEQVQSWLDAADKEGAVVAVTPKDAVKIEALGFRNKIHVLERELLSKEWVKLVFERLQS